MRYNLRSNRSCTPPSAQELSAGFGVELSLSLSERPFNSDIREPNQSNVPTPPHHVIIEACAGVNISRSSTQYAPLGGKSPARSVAQRAPKRRSGEDRTKEAHNVVMAWRAKKTKQVCEPIVAAPLEPVHQSLAVHKEQSESHTSKSFAISHLHQSFSKNNYSKAFRASESQTSQSPNKQTAAIQYQATSARGAL